MLFNVHHGQMRARKDMTGITKMQYLSKSPKNKLIVAGVVMAGLQSGQSVEYMADDFGNIEINHPGHIKVMIDLGYPIYDGDHKQNPVPLDDLLYPTLESDSTYWRRINEALSRRQ